MCKLCCDSQVGDYFNAYPNYILALFDEVLQRKAMEVKTASLGHRDHKEQRTTKTFHTRVTGQTPRFTPAATIYNIYEK